MIRQAILGHAIADAMGVPFEFRARDTFTVSDYEGFGSWDVPAGSFSDDSSMLFCTMAHQIEQSSLDDLKQKFCDWLYEGYWTYNGQASFDVGNTTKLAIDQWLQHGFDAPIPCDESQNGNGALMRILPVMLAATTHDDIFSLSRHYALTHLHIRSILSCTFFGHIVLALKSGYNFTESMHLAQRYTQPHFMTFQGEQVHFARLMDGSIVTAPRESINSSGYVIDTLEAVCWSIAQTSSYEQAIMTAIELGNDTDTVGALTGSLAGMLYGLHHIPSHWIHDLARIDDIEQLIQDFEQQCC
ncbi:ADP-ribosylglycohydrolase family protein [Kurthia huakuii]|uniref:ADP-ribosylglycohydrolase family protein n=1 Tax=Kurthia huakuii TaxID=1421019 RepID=UPI0004975E4E|nr:ADP-ribosylglycohydrolase family protein [Kurthia huakuii]MBM7699275.1 ADP-ribosylglycohydrolase [Kurthia huakuii]